MSTFPLSDSLASLHDVITSDCDKSSKMELFVMDGLGEEFPVYSGFMTGFCVEHLYTALRNTGTFYNFTLTTISGSSKNAMSRREFCWLTPPAPLRVRGMTPSSLCLAFDRAMVCGITDDAASERIVGRGSNLEYVISVCQGSTYQKSKASKYAGDSSNIEAGDFKEVYRGPYRKEVTVEGLRPSTWYHLRLSICSPGLAAHSATVSEHTTSAVPDAVTLPRVTVIERSKYYEAAECDLNAKGFDYSQDRIKLVWTNPHDNGSAIIKYQVLLQEVLLVEEKPAAGDGSAASRLSAQAETSVWKTVYNNLLPECQLSAPSKKVIEWRVRVRCYNSVGWSECGQQLLLNAKTLPGLFNSGY